TPACCEVDWLASSAERSFSIGDESADAKKIAFGFAFAFDGRCPDEATNRSDRERAVHWPYRSGGVQIRDVARVTHRRHSLTARCRTSSTPPQFARMWMLESIVLGRNGRKALCFVAAGPSRAPRMALMWYVLVGIVALVVVFLVYLRATTPSRFPFGS